MLKESRHDIYCREDYQLLQNLEIKTVREGLAWSQIDQGNNIYDFSRFENIMKIGQEEGIQQIWDLNHFDYPDYLDPFTDLFITQFAEYAKRAITIIRKYQTGTLYIAPINEISFFAWIGADRGVWAPYKKGMENGLAFKKQLVKASIAAMDAIWKIDSDVEFIHIDPFMQRVAKEPANDLAKAHVDEFNNIIRLEAWDMLSGKTYPELGGDPKYLNIVGMNYYFHNQEWVKSVGQNNIKHQAMGMKSPGRVSFEEMIKTVYDRYKKPIFISETGSYDKQRYLWWRRVLNQIDEAKNHGLPVVGVCAYPAVDRPEWINYLLPHSGLWDFEGTDKECLRIPHEKTLSIIKWYSKKWNKN